MRYGTKHCANDRLPAEKLEQAVTRRLWKVLENNDLLDLAINETYQRLSERAGNQTSERDAINRKLTETRAAMDRYFRAFENGTMPEDTCAPRLAALSEQAKALEARAAELATITEDTEQPERITRTDLDALRHELRAALEHSTPARTKTVLQAMIDGIRVDACDSIEPTFRVPAVREPCGSMVEEGERLRTVRVYDNAHGVHDMHRYNQAGEKQPAEVLHHGSASEALQSALRSVRDGYREMIESWRR
jgi:hypothetical protein